MSSSSVNESPYNMFDGSISTYYRSSISPSFPENITVSFPKPYMISDYTVKIGYGNISFSNMKTWDFYGLIGGSYVLLHSGTNPSQTANTITGTFSPVVVNGIKIVCKAGYGGNSWGIDELVVYEFNYQYQYLIQDKNNNLFTYSSQSDKLQETLSDTLFINKGMTDPTIMNNQQPITRGIYGKDNGTLGTGKYFEISLNNSVKKINNHPLGREVDATDRITDKSFLRRYGMEYPLITINIPSDYYSTFKYSLYEAGGYGCAYTVTYYYTDGTNTVINRSVSGIYTTILSDKLDTNKKCNKITIKLNSSQTQFASVQLFKYFNVFYLIQYNSQLYTFDSRDIVSSSSQTLNEDNFKTNGLIDLTAIAELQWKMAFQDKSNVKILLWTDDIDTTDAKIIYDCERYDIAQWLKDNGCNLLMWTDDNTKTSTSMVYNTNPYTPLDNLDEFDILEYIK